MRAIKDSTDNPPRANLSSAATHLLSRPETACEFAAIRERLAEVAADLRHMALTDDRAKDELISMARKLDAMATEENLA